MYSRKWEIEDEEKTPLERTPRILKESLKKVEECLEFTLETGDDYDGWLQTLDKNIRAIEENMVEYKYFEKPTMINTTK